MLMRPTLLGEKWESYNMVQRQALSSNSHTEESSAGLRENGQSINPRYNLKVLPNGRSVPDAHSPMPLFFTPLDCEVLMQR